MSRKENFLRVLNHQFPRGEVPLWELHFHLWDKLSDKRFISGQEFMKLSAAEQDYALRQDAEIMVKLGQELCFSAVSIPDTPWDCIYTLPQESRVKLVKYLKSLNPDFAVVCGCSGIICMPASANEFEEFCYQMFDEPEEIDELCKTTYATFLNYAEQFVDAGIDAIYMAADVADNRAPFFNREQQLRWYIPYLNQSVEFLHGQNIPAILHTDGNVNMLLGDIKASGVDGLQAIDPIAGMDIRKVQEFMENKVAVCGNLDCCVMLTAGPEQVYEEAKRILLACKDQPGFIFGNSNAVTIETPVENYMALLAAWKEFGRI